MSNNENEMRSEYEAKLIRSGERGKYAKRLREEGSNIVRIDSDLLEQFPDSEAVNKALREHIQRLEQDAR